MGLFLGEKKDGGTGMSLMNHLFLRMGLGLSALFLGVPAFASHPLPMQMGMQPAATPVMEHIVSFHNLLLIIISSIVAFVLLLLVYIMIRFNAKRNPIPSKTSHHTLLEVVWTIVPVIILLVIIVPSLKLIYFMDRAEDAEMTVKVIGHQWYWSYEYPDHDKLAFDSLMLKDNELQPGQFRLLEVDNRLVIPVNTTVRVVLTSEDVLHSWAVPAMGVKTDCVPGRLNETWLRVDREGIYYGQCSELCGRDHGFMPIAVEVVSKEQFESWLAEAKTKFAALTFDQPTHLAYVQN